MERARKLMASAMRSAEGSPLVKRLMRTELSPDCTIGLLRFMRGVRNLEPWAVRLIDASGKYPTGLFQGTISDIGAYDECIETIVHDQFGHVQTSGQYCNIYIKMVNDTSFIEHMLPAFLMTNKRVSQCCQAKHRKSGSKWGNPIANCLMAATVAISGLKSALFSRGHWAHKHLF